MIKRVLTMFGEGFWERCNHKGNADWKKSRNTNNNAYIPLVHPDAAEKVSVLFFYTIISVVFFVIFLIYLFCRH